MGTVDNLDRALSRLEEAAARRRIMQPTPPTPGGGCIRSEASDQSAELSAMTNERKPKKTRGPSKAARAAEVLRAGLVEGADITTINGALAEAGLPDLALPKGPQRRPQRGPAPALREPPADRTGGNEELMEGLASTREQIMHRIKALDESVELRASAALDRVNDIARTTMERVEELDGQIGSLTIQVGLLAQLLQQVDPGRIVQAVEALQGAKAQYEAPPLRVTVREAAAAIAAGERPPRRKLGVTVDGSLWAAAEEIQRRQRCTISEIIDRALACWLDHQGEN